VSIDRQMLRRVIVNLVRNAIEAVRGARPEGRGMGPQGRVSVRAQRSGATVIILVEDDGPGVAADSRERGLDPYFTRKRQGTGLGLAIVKKIVVEHNGTITAGRSERLGGAEFAVVLPVTAPSSAQGSAEHDPRAGEAPPSRRSVA